jgi:hypothetical protein
MPFLKLLYLYNVLKINVLSRRLEIIDIFLSGLKLLKIRSEAECF